MRTSRSGGGSHAVARRRAVAATMAAALGLQETPGQTHVEAVLRHLRSRSAVVVMDNCEHVLDDASDLMGRLLSGCQRLRMLATSREPVGLAGETVYQVPSLSLPGPSVPDDLTVLGAFDAIAFFADRAVSIQPSFRLDMSNMTDVAEICRRLDGIPLAIEFAAIEFAATRVAT